MSKEAFEGVSSCSMQDACHRKPNIGLTNQNFFCNSMAEHQSIKSDGPNYVLPYLPPPPPPDETEARELLRKSDTNRVP